MHKVSESAEELLAQLVAWELLGRDDLNPKMLLREVPLADLSVVSANILKDADLRNLERTTIIQMVGLELQYRTGKIKDWGYVRVGPKVEITIQLNMPVKFIPLKLVSVGSDAA